VSVPAIEILFQDQAIVVVAKPSGLLVHRTEEATDQIAVLQLARDATGGEHLYPVHRLDRGASGVLVFGRSSESARLLHEQMEAGTADKRYLALVRGTPPAAGSIDHAIPRRLDGPRVPALTEYRLLASVTVPFVRNDGSEQPQAYSLVEARPRSGRPHQVRRHLKHITHPIIGDVQHGRSEHNRFCLARFALGRLALHARSLTFDHPASGQRVTFVAPVPEDLRVPLLRMGFTLEAL
jgi:tRNA pseudouridine65 synthase